MVDLLAVKGLTTGEISEHLAEVCGAEVSRQTISTITDKVIEGMVEWQNRPLANRPIYVALAVTCEGRRDILRLWPARAPSTGCTYPGGVAGTDLVGLAAANASHNKLRRHRRPTNRPEVWKTASNAALHLLSRLRSRKPQGLHPRSGVCGELSGLLHGQATPDGW